MRISDWSSDVCSSDLAGMLADALAALQNLEPVAALRASRWVYPLVNTAHIAGIALLFGAIAPLDLRSEEHTSELQSLMRISYAVFCLKKKNIQYHIMFIHKTRATDTTNTRMSN